MLQVLLATAGAACIGAAGPAVMRRLPESDDRRAGSPGYAELARTRGLAAWLAVCSAGMAALVAISIDTPELVAVWVVVAGVGSWLAFIDWHTHLLPFLIVAPLYVVSLLLVVLGAVLLDDRDVLLRALVANVVVYAVFLLLYWVAGRFFAGGFGYGDVRLSAVLAVSLGALGTGEVAIGIYGGFVLGGVFGVLLARLKVIDSHGYAFGPYMVVAAVIGAAWGPAIY